MERPILCPKDHGADGLLMNTSARQEQGRTNSFHEFVKFTSRVHSTHPPFDLRSQTSCGTTDVQSSGLSPSDKPPSDATNQHEHVHTRKQTNHRHVFRGRGETRSPNVPALTASFCGCIAIWLCQCLRSPLQARQHFPRPPHRPLRPRGWPCPMQKPSAPST